MDTAGLGTHRLARTLIGEPVGHISLPASSPSTMPKTIRWVARALPNFSSTIPVPEQGNSIAPMDTAGLGTHRLARTLIGEPVGHISFPASSVAASITRLVGPLATFCSTTVPEQ